MEKPSDSRDVLGYDETYGWVVCMWIETFGWCTGFEDFVDGFLPIFSPIRWVEMPKECGEVYD